MENNEADQKKPRRVPLRQTATYKRVHDEFVTAGREYQYRMALLGGKQMGSVACGQPSYVTGPEIEKVAADFADSWAEFRRKDDALCGLQQLYNDSYRHPCVDENDEIIPDPESVR